MTTRLRCHPALALVLVLWQSPVAAFQTDFDPKLPAPEGFRVYFITDMEGMASVVFNREIISGWEGDRYRDQSSRDYWEHYRALFTEEVNAAIEGARRGGAASFVVNEGHGGNLFANLLPWQLDTAALLVRGWPKPMVMSAAIDSTAGALVFIGAHANAGSPGVISHNYAFDRLAVNGRNLNETGINALVAGEFGVPVIFVSGDDVVTQEARDQLGPGITTVITKYALSRSAAITYSPAVVRQMLRDSVAVAVRRAVRGEFEPFQLSKPYRVEIDVRESYPRELIAPIDTLSGFRLEKTGDRSYVLVTSDARELARLLDAIELVVLR
jgi:D-amino peptidase